MRACKRTLVAATAVLLAASSTSWAIDWLPFGKKETTRTPMVAGQPLVTRAPTGPTVAQKITDGTKKVVHGTVDLVTLKPLRDSMSDDKPTHPESPFQMTQPKPAAAKKPGMFESLFGAKKPKRPSTPQTMSEWVSQPRVKP